MVKFLFSLSIFFLPSLSYFFYILFFPQHTYKSQVISPPSFFFSFLFSLLNFPHHIFTHPLPTMHFTPTPSLFLFPSIFLFSTVHIFTGFVHFFFFFIPNTHSWAQVCYWVSFFLLEVSLGFVNHFCWVCWEMKKLGCSISIWECSIF